MIEMVRRRRRRWKVEMMAWGMSIQQNFYEDCLHGPSLVSTSFLTSA